jgi:hypothetical protein
LIGTNAQLDLDHYGGDVSLLVEELNIAFEKLDP